MSVNDYEINCSTLLVMPDESNGMTKILEIDDEIVARKKCLKIIDNSCRFFGSSLEGRQEGTKSLLDVAVKAPIIVEESKNIIFFPTASPREAKCMWVSFNNLLKYTKLDKRNSKLYFEGGKEIIISVSYNIIDNQVTRCIKLEKVLFDRKKMVN